MLRNKKNGVRIIFAPYYAMRQKIILTPFFLLFLASVLYAQDQFTYDSKGKRNPFIPLVTSDGRLIKLEARQTTGGLALEGIIYDKISMSYAIVNGAVVKVGEFVDDYQVLKIEENKVIFIKDGQPFEVELKKEGE